MMIRSALKLFSLFLLSVAICFFAVEHVHSMEEDVLFYDFNVTDCIDNLRLLASFLRKKFGEDDSSFMNDLVNTQELFERSYFLDRKFNPQDAPKLSQLMHQLESHVTKYLQTPDSAQVREIFFKDYSAFQTAYANLEAAGEVYKGEQYGNNVEVLNFIEQENLYPEHMLYSEDVKSDNFPFQEDELNASIATDSLNQEPKIEEPFIEQSSKNDLPKEISTETIVQTNKDHSVPATSIAFAPKIPLKEALENAEKRVLGLLASFASVPPVASDKVASPRKSSVKSEKVVTSFVLGVLISQLPTNTKFFAFLNMIATDLNKIKAIAQGALSGNSVESTERAYMAQLTNDPIQIPKSLLRFYVLGLTLAVKFNALKNAMTKTLRERASNNTEQTVLEIAMRVARQKEELATIQEDIEILLASMNDMNLVLTRLENEDTTPQTLRTLSQQYDNLLAVNAKTAEDQKVRAAAAAAASEIRKKSAVKPIDSIVVEVEPRYLKEEQNPIKKPSPQSSAAKMSPSPTALKPIPGSVSPGEDSSSEETNAVDISVTPTSSIKGEQKDPVSVKSQTNASSSTVKRSEISPPTEWADVVQGKQPAASQSEKPTKPQPQTKTKKQETNGSSNRGRGRGGGGGRKGRGRGRGK
jgi:hypothetical protein